MPRRAVKTDPRAVAHELLVRVETTDAFADLLLADRLAAAALDARDAALVTRLVYGTLASTAAYAGTRARNASW